jgi:putative DNA primase/helicase
MSVNLATGAAVYCAMNAHNLIEVTRLVRRYNQRATVIIAADNDHKRTDNPGLAAANKARESTKAIVRFPEFKDKEAEYSDFNDLMLEQGLDAVRKALEAGVLESDLEFVEPLGYEDQSYYFFTSSNPQVTILQEFSRQKLFHLMPKEYWERIYGVPGKLGIAVDYDQVASELMLMCRSRGIFKPEGVRGAGVWQDGEKTVVNLGNSLHYDGKEHSLFSLQSGYQYVLGRAGKTLHPNKATESECKVMREILEILRFREDSQRIFFGGWIFGALICGSLKWRPHILLTGEQGSGKSFLFANLIHQLFSAAFDACYVKSDSSAAGIRQKIKNNALPLLFDEFESDGQTNKEEKNKAVLELCRQASVEDDSTIVKGSAVGKHVDFSAKFMACLSGINAKVTNSQDTARFTTIELVKVVGEPEQYNKLVNAINKLDEDFCKRLFSRAVHKVPTILEDIERFKQEVMQRGFPDRVGQQYGTLLACYYHMLYDTELTKTQIESLVAKYITKNEPVAEMSQNTDMDECLNHLLMSKVKVGMSEAPLITLLSGYDGATAEEKSKRAEALLMFGLRVMTENGVQGLAIPNKNPELIKIFNQTAWMGNWNQSLKRIKGVERNFQFKVKGKPMRGVLIPLDIAITGGDPLEGKAF